MDLGIVSELSVISLTLCFLVAIAGGLVKGAIGFALPLILVSGISSILDPKIAIASIIFSTVATNTFQTFRYGLTPALEALIEHWRYVLCVCVAIFISAQLVPYFSSRAFYFVLGVPVVGLSLVQLLGVRLQIAPHYRRRAEIVIGVISGTLGGFAGTWGPTTVLYLLAINVPKTKQMITQGVVYGAGSFMLLGGHLQSSVLNANTAPLSLILLAPALFGLWLGTMIQDRLDQAAFKRITLIVLVIAGINLLRKGVMG